MTRKILPALCLMALAVVPAAAQTARSNFIANLGFTWSTVGGSDAAKDFKSRNGFFGGLGYQVPFNESLSGRFEVNYETKGVELPSDELARYGIQTAYVDVPLMVQYTFGTETGNILPAIFAGPQVGFEVSCNQQTLVTGSGAYDQMKCVEPPTRNKFVVDFNLGGQVAISHIVLGLRYSYGFTRILKDSVLPAFKNRVLAVTVGYTF